MRGGGDVSYAMSHASTMFNAHTIAFSASGAHLSARRPGHSARVSINARTHARLRALAIRRFGRKGSASRLGSLVLDEYLSVIERAYFGAPRVTACQKLDDTQRTYDAVIFDMDGVLCDSEHVSRYAAVETLRKHYAVDAMPDDFAPFTGTGEAAFLKGVADKYAVPDFDAEEAKRRFFDIYINGGFVLELRPFPGVLQLVMRIKDLGLKVAVASAADQVKVNANLNAIGLPAHTFDFVTSSDDIVNKKPAPDVFLAAAKGLGLLPQRCVVVEDAAVGVQSALAAGMRCVAVTTSLSEEQLSEHNPHVIRKEPAMIQLTDLFGEHFRVEASAQTSTVPAPAAPDSDTDASV